MQRTKRSTRGQKAPKSKNTRSRGSRNSSEQRLFGTTLQSQTMLAHITRPMATFKFGAAAPHEDFPDGGMRACGTCLATGNVSTTAAITRLFGGASGFVVGPQAVSVSGNLAGMNDASSFLAVSSTYFRQWICRYLRIRYVPGVGTVSTEWDGIKEITIGYDFDGLVQAVAYAGAITPQQLGGTRTVSFTPSVPAELVAIPKQKESRDDQLQWITGKSDVVLGSTAPMEARSISQGAVLLFGLNVPTTGSVTLGQLWLDWEFDLYGFTNLPSLGNATFSRRLAESQNVETKQSVRAAVRELSADDDDNAGFEMKSLTREKGSSREGVSLGSMSGLTEVQAASSKSAPASMTPMSVSSKTGAGVGVIGAALASADSHYVLVRKG